MGYLNRDTNGTDVTIARLNHELKIYAKPARSIRATAKNKQIIIPANVRQAGPITSKHNMKGIWKRAGKVNPFNVLMTVNTTQFGEKQATMERKISIVRSKKKDVRRPYLKCIKHIIRHITTCNKTSKKIQSYFHYSMHVCFFSYLSAITPKSTFPKRLPT